MIGNKILGKVTKFVEKLIKTSGVANRFMVWGTMFPPPPGLYIGLSKVISLG